MTNEQWAKNWGIPEEGAFEVRAKVQSGLWMAFSANPTKGVRVQPCHLEKPGAAGVYLLEAMGVDMTPLPQDLQLLISKTSCQHRVEFFSHQGDTIPSLRVYDGRAMYMGCCVGLGIAGGRYKHETNGYMDIGPEERGRARVGFQVPSGWSHVGLLAVKALSGWLWPSTPGEVYETWADLCEIRYARSLGWKIWVCEKVTWPEARPLDLWAQRLSRIYLDAKEAGLDDLTTCYRAIALHTIGRMHNLGYRDARATVGPDDPRVTFENTEAVTPEGVQIRERVTINKPEAQCHPEWSAAIWSHCHLRVAKALMSLDRKSVLAVRGDAITFTGPTPSEWPLDAGKVGQFRVKTTAGGPLQAPRNWEDLRGLC